MHLPLITSVALTTVAVLGATFEPILPPSYPLAVRNPYFSAWLPGNQAENLATAVPEFWAGQKLTWSVMARVDGQAYGLFGVPEAPEGVQAATLDKASVSATHTTFEISAGSANIVLDFFSPVSPLNYMRQSLPMSYLTVSTSGRDGASPNVQVYSDIDDSWTGSFGFSVADRFNWESTVGETQVFWITPDGRTKFTEEKDMALWGRAIYSTRPNASKLRSRTGLGTALRSQFATDGAITGDWDWDIGSVVAYSHDLEQVDSWKNVTFVIGYDRDPAVNYLGSDWTGYWRSECSDFNCASVHALEDFHAADAESRALDAAVTTLAHKVAGSNYSDILTMSVRQAFGAIDLVVPSDSKDPDQVLAFMKEISSNGNTNTIDVIFPMAPLFYAVVPEYMRLLLEPVMRYSDTGAWPREFMIHDLGAHYPNATGHDDGDAEQMPLEECGNMLILALMYEKATGNKAWAAKYSALLKQYADYLVTNGLYPAKQLSSDDALGEIANQTSLAVKAAIALNAYGVMTGQKFYSDTGIQFAKSLYSDKLGTDPEQTHFTLEQGDAQSWRLQYNLYPDVLLGLHTFPTSAYVMDSAFYPSVRETAGVPLDTMDTWGKTDWMQFSAAVAMAEGNGNEGVRDMFVDDVYAFLTNGSNEVPFGDAVYVENSGEDVAGTFANGYKARPVVGGHFAILALEGAGSVKF